MEEKLSKKERRELRREEERQKEAKKNTQKKLMKWGIIGGIVVLLGLGGWWFIQENSKPLPGSSVKDLGRDHIPKTEWEKYQYNSNPPTSGPHDTQWTKAGVYDGTEGVGYLVHSLEHGYVIISYNCAKKFSIFPIRRAQGRNFQFSIPQGYAHGTEEEHAKEATPSATMDEKVWNTNECQDLKNKLSEVANKKRLWKLIVVRRPSLDKPIALTAWTRIDKMDKIDNERIARFIDAFRDKGPEKTME